MKALCIIPARGGSKRIPRKNIKQFLGRPIIAYSIEAALESKLFDTVMVSTEDPEIAGVAKAHGAAVPFLRSSEHADDQTGLAEVLLEVLSQYGKQGYDPELVCCLFATAPFVSAQDLIYATRRLQRSTEFDAVLPIVRYSHPIQRSLKVDESGYISMVWPEHRKTRTQDLDPRFHDAGQYYVIRRDALERGRSLFPERSFGVETGEHRVQDIDTPEDWLLAETKYQIKEVE